EVFELNILKTTWPGGAITIGPHPMPLPAPHVPNADPPPNPSVTMTVRMQAIGTGDSLLADVDYRMGEHDGNSEQPIRGGSAQLVFAWQANDYGSCRMVGTDRGYSGT